MIEACFLDTKTMSWLSESIHYINALIKKGHNYNKPVCQKRAFIKQSLDEKKLKRTGQTIQWVNHYLQLPSLHVSWRLFVQMYLFSHSHTGYVISSIFRHAVICNPFRKGPFYRFSPTKISFKGHCYVYDIVEHRRP